MFDLAYLNWQRRRWRSRARPPLDALLRPPVRREDLERPAKLLAMDLELTGLDPDADSIVSVAWVPVRDGRVLLSAAAHLLVRSPEPVGASATIHQLRDCDLHDGAPLEQALAELLEQLRDHTMLLHGGVDLPFLNRACRKHFGAPLPVPVIDTALVERKRRERRHQPIGKGDLKLGNLRQVYGLPRYRPHDALGDAVATAELYLAMIARG